MTWLLWRQHRLQAALAAAALVAFGIPVLITGRHLASDLRSCRASSSCGNFDLFNGYQPIVTVVFLTMLVPLLVGVFWAAPLVGKELETGTATLAWTQATTRRHWMRTKLLTLFGGAALLGCAVSGLVTWWSDAHNSLVESRFVGVEFDIQGVAPVGYTLFAAAVGLASGVLWRRVLPAMATTVGAFVGVRLLVELALRPNYMAPVTRYGLGAPVAAPTGSWMQGSELTLNGRVVRGAIQPAATCTDATSRDAMSQCMARAGYRVRTTYQPADRYWTFQWIEFGIFVGLAVALVVTALVVLRRRDA